MENGENRGNAVHVAPLKAKKNIDGSQGARCEYCSGAGYTVSIKGSSMGCHRCYGTGVEPPNIYDMAKEIEKLKKRVKKLEGK